VCKSGRGYGRQNILLKNLVSISDEAIDPLMIFSDPFKIRKHKLCTDSLRAMHYFLTGDYGRPYKYDEALQQQKARFIEAGFVNASWEFANVTTEDQQFLFIPDSLTENDKKVCKSRLI
jgi:hypothetical protein